MRSLMNAIALLPNDHYVTFSKDQEEDDGPRWFLEDGPRWFLGACVFQKAPKTGWTSRGAYFGLPPSTEPWSEPCPPQWTRDARVIFGVTAEDPATLERLLIDAIAERWSDRP